MKEVLVSRPPENRVLNGAPPAGILAQASRDSEQDAALLVTVVEAARRLSIGRPKMYDLVMRGEVLSVKIGASRRVPVTALEAYVQRLTEAAEAEQQRRNPYGTTWTQ